MKTMTMNKSNFSPIWRASFVTAAILLASSFAVMDSRAHADGPVINLGSLTYTGMVQPHKLVTLIAPVDGVLKTMKVEEGDKVTEGQVLAEMDDGVQREVVNGALLKSQDESAAHKADILIADSQLELDKVVHLQSQNAAGDWEVKKAKLQLDQAKVSLEAAKNEQGLAIANHKLELERLQRFALKAPFAGVIIKKSTEAGATLTHTDQVLQIAEMTNLEAQMNLPIELYGQLEVGKEYRLDADVPVKRVLVAKMKSIDPIIDTASRTFRCVLAIDNKDLALPAGFTVNLLLDNTKK